jgi:hypothetical protein
VDALLDILRVWFDPTLPHRSFIGRDAGVAKRQHIIIHLIDAG